jgi:hypothetical protein
LHKRIRRYTVIDNGDPDKPLVLTPDCDDLAMNQPIINPYQTEFLYDLTSYVN